MLRLTTYYLAVEATLLTCIQEMSCSNLDHYADFPGSDLPQLLQARTGILPSVTVDPEYFLSNFK